MAYLLKDDKGSPIKHNGATAHGADFSGVVKAVNESERTITLIASTNDPDRQGDIIDQAGWQLSNYIKNPVFLWAHSHRSVPLARAIKIQRTASELIMTLKFPQVGINPFGDMIYNLYKERVINASSVGFFPLEFEDIKDSKNRRTGGKKFTKMELLELSGCAIPANPQALQQAVKAIPGSDKNLLMQTLFGTINLSEQFCNAEDVRSELEAIAVKGPVQLDDATAAVNKNKNYKGVPMDKLLKKKMKLLEKLAYMAERGEDTDAVKAELKQVEDEMQKGFPIPNPDNKSIEPKDRIYFRDKDGREHPAITIKENFSSLVSEDNFEERISAGNIIRAHILGDFKDLNKTERELMAKAQQEGTGSLGGYLLPSPVSSQIIDLARNKMQVMKAGARTMKMDTGELTLVKVLTDPSVFWRAENSEITESDDTFEPINLKPMVAGALIRVSLELLADASNAGSTLENMMAASLALEQDRVALLGTGVNEPLGLDNTTGVEVISMGTNGAAPSDYDEFSEAAQKIAENNGVAKSVIIAPRTYFTLDRLKEGTTNAPLPPPQSYEALNKYYTNQIPIDDTKGSSSTCSKAYIGDFSNLLFAIRNDITIEASKSGGGSSGNDAFARMEVLIRAFLRIDIAIIRPNHFCKIEGLK